MRVLVVDDMSSMRMMIKAVLREYGIVDIKEAGDGVKAMELLDKELPDLMLVDVMMPGADGYQVCRTLRAEGRQVPIIFISAKGEEIDKVVGLEARGFIIGGAIAHKLSVGFVPVRKKGKLPHETVRVAYSLEYGVDEMEMHKDAVKTGERGILVRRRPVGTRPGSVVDPQPRLHLREAADDRLDRRGERSVEHDRTGVGVVPQVEQLVRGVAVVRVHRSEGALEGGEGRLHVLRAVVEILRHGLLAIEPGDHLMLVSAGGKIVRIGHMGHVNAQMMMAALGSIEVGHLCFSPALQRSPRPSSAGSTNATLPPNVPTATDGQPENCTAGQPSN